jgi:hypothetical protein
MDPLSSEEKSVNQLLKSLKKPRLTKIGFQTTASKSLLDILNKAPIGPNMYGRGFSLDKHTKIDDDDCLTVLGIVESMVSAEIECDDMETLLNYPPSYFYLKIQANESLTQCEQIVALYHRWVVILLSMRELTSLSPEKEKEISSLIQDQDKMDFLNIHRGTQTFMTIFGMDQEISIVQSMVRKHAKDNDLSYYTMLRYDPSSGIDDKIERWSGYCKKVDQIQAYIKNAHPRWSKYTLDEKKKAKESLKLFLNTFEIFTKTEIDNLLSFNLNQMNKAKAIFLHSLDFPFITLDFAIDITAYSKFS